MKRVLILGRDDLIDGRKLTHVSEVEMADFSGTYAQMADYELAIFQCSLTGLYKIIKNRYSETTGELPLDGEENMEKFVARILEHTT
jgi:hypothetical protein